ATTAATLQIISVDDEDGIPVASSGVNEGLFLDNNGQVVGFLNPLQTEGTPIVVNASAAGLLDAWVDLNADGDFLDEGEQLVRNVALVPGENLIRVHTPINESISGRPDPRTWARFRVSPTGNTTPTGIAIGGEVEDHRVLIAGVPTAAVVDDLIAPPLVEDTQRLIDVAELLGNDLNIGALQNPQIIIEVQPQNAMPLPVDANGILQLDGNNMFPYMGDLDFNGRDEFVYSVIGNVDIGNGIVIPYRTPDSATVTVDITPVNDIPEFTVAMSEVDVLEKGDDPSRLVLNVITDARPGPITAVDEQFDPAVTFTLVGTSDPGNIMDTDPTLEVVGGRLTVFPKEDEIGTVVYTFAAVDHLGAMSPTQDITVNVRPVNDAPTPDTNTIGSSGGNGDDAWTVNAAGVVTYNVPEDGSVTIPLRQSPGGPIGLLDIFVPGPVNESTQNLSIDEASLPANINNAGITLQRDGGGNVTGITITPNTDFNAVFGGLLAFQFDVIDDGQSFNLTTGMLEADPQSGTGLARINVIPVNDAPSFVAGNRQQTSGEDSIPSPVAGWASSISAGPAGALDELQNQTLQFILTPVDQSAADNLFAGPNGQSPVVNGDGSLQYRPAQDASGTAVFNVTLVDSGSPGGFVPGTTPRGDVNFFDGGQLTITITEVNDPPVPDGRPLIFDGLEDEFIDIPVRGSSPTDNGLLDGFTPGPANEAGQTLSLRRPIVTVTANGGTLTPMTDGNGRELLRYRPRRDFNGQDSFVFEVEDDGVPSQSAFGVVTINVAAVNDPPVFGGAADLVRCSSGIHRR
ncbi:MAG: tandem-95 repeat protein, partial [Planctomycetota bacterium]